MAADTAPLAAVEPVVAAAPEVPATPAPVAEPVAPRSDGDLIREAVNKVLPVGEDGQLVKPGTVPKPAEVAPVVAAKTPEEIEAEKIAAGITETPEAKVAREQQEAAKAAEAKPVVEADPLDKLGPLPAEKLAQVLTEKPELATALEAAGIPKDVLFETARQAALTSQFTEIFPTVDAAKFAQESAGHFYDIEEGFPTMQSVDDFDKFLVNTMVPLSYVLGADGKPQLEADGKSYKTDGSVARFMKLSLDFDSNQAKSHIGNVLADIKRLPDGEDKTRQEEYFNDLQAAIDFYQDFRNAGYKMPGPKQEVTALSPENQARLDRAAQIERESNERNQVAQSKEKETFDTQVGDDATTFVQTVIGDFLKRSSLTDILKTKAAKEIYDEIGEKLEANKEHQRLSASYRAKGLTPEARQKLRVHNETTVRGLYAKIAERIVGEYGGTLIAAQDSRLAKIAAQTTTANIHPSSTSSAAAKGPQVLTDQQINDQVTKNAKEAGKDMDIGWQMQERLRLSGKLVTA